MRAMHLILPWLGVETLCYGRLHYRAFWFLSSRGQLFDVGMETDQKNNGMSLLLFFWLCADEVRW